MLLQMFLKTKSEVISGSNFKASATLYYAILPLSVCLELKYEYCHILKTLKPILEAQDR